MSPSATSSSSSPPAAAQPSTTDASDLSDWTMNIAKSKQRQQLLKQQWNKLPSFHRSWMASLRFDILMAFCFGTTAFFLFMILFMGSNGTSRPEFYLSASILWVIGCFYFTMRMNFYITKYYTLALGVFHDIDFSTLTYGFTSFSLAELSTKHQAHVLQKIPTQQKQEAAEKWLGCLPVSWKAIFKFLLIMWAVLQLGSATLKTYTQENTASSTLSVTVFAFITDTLQDHYEIVFWTIMGFTAILVGCGFGILLLSMWLGEPWLIRLAKIFFQAVYLAIFEIKGTCCNLSYIATWFVDLFTKFFIINREQPGRTTSRAWIISFVTSYASIVEAVFLPLTMFLLKSLACTSFDTISSNSVSYLLASPSVQCWSTRHLPFLVSSLLLLAPWYFIATFIASWISVYFSLEEIIATRCGQTPSLIRDSMILFDPHYQFRIFGARVILAGIALIVGPASPFIACILTLVLSLILFYIHHGIPLNLPSSVSTATNPATPLNLYPSNVAVVNFWQGCGLIFVIYCSAMALIGVTTSLPSVIISMAVAAGGGVIAIGTCLAWYLRMVPQYGGTPKKTKKKSHLQLLAEKHNITADSLHANLLSPDADSV